MDRHGKCRIHLKTSDVTHKILEREEKKGHLFINRPKLNGEEILASGILLANPYHLTAPLVKILSAFLPLVFDRLRQIKY